MKIKCECGKKLKSSKPMKVKVFICPKCKRKVTLGPPIKIGNFKLGEDIYTRKYMLIKSSRQAALQLNAKVILFDPEKHPEIIIGAKKLATAPFATTVSLLDMGTENGWGYVALQGDVEPDRLAAWFLRGTTSGVKKPFFKRPSTWIVPLIFISILSVVLMSFGVGVQGKKAADMYKNSDGKVRRAALKLATNNAEGTALLIKALSDSLVYVRVAACQSLARRKGKDVVKALDMAMLDKSKTVRDAARRALKRQSNILKRKSRHYGENI